MSPGTTLLNAAGGLGLFLLGMALMTEGLRNLAGHRLRQALLRFTRSPWSGACSGALTTAIVQSSSATTVMTVGFVSAGLLSFQAAVGIILGANVGSTGLGWLVALLGIKLNLQRLMLPLVLVGACLRLLGRARQAQAGLALAGFALLFIGIGGLQEAMAGHGLLLDPARFDAEQLTGRFQLLLLGLLTTVITQSSGAGVATALAAIGAGAIAVPQACALVIGMDLGTTVTALIAAMGAGLGARRTAAAHVAFNLFTALLAFTLLPLYLLGLRQGWPAFLARDPEFALTAFHTGFNVAGVLLILPFASGFAGLIRRLVPPSRDRPTEELTDTPPKDPMLAVDQASTVLGQSFVALLTGLRQALTQPQTTSAALVRETGLGETDLERLELFVDQVELPGLPHPVSARLLHLLHGLDHLQRLHERCTEEEQRRQAVATAPALQRERDLLLHGLDALIPLLGQGSWQAAGPVADACARRLHRRVDPFRQEVMERIAAGSLDVEEGTALLEAMRWLRRVSQHLQRICHHLVEVMGPGPPAPLDGARAT
ncbi:Na/Pi cotransporter family protein [Cyanobium sp. NIES-981]|uniref:Na/Pi cotransporter family protein n=1 Tax=Cyanobium sp. NIES-981 TaxID=1851505 RepID=UPI0007DD04D1|nr:Na/Pi symporter [Cyanobium sp. NIES-981]SBO42769.1 Na/Pi-cotransporter family protein/PhoU family protein [Cyanobium sp. NIES-981]